MIKNGRKTSNYRIQFNYDSTSVENIRRGTVVAFAGDIAPTGWRLCNGSTINRETYVDLFNVVGTKFGSGDGSVTFNLPDLRGVFVRGLSGASGRDPDSASRSCLLSGGCAGNNIGSYQSDYFKLHCHIINHNHPNTTSSSDTHFHFIANNLVDPSGAIGNPSACPSASINRSACRGTWDESYCFAGINLTPTVGRTTSNTHTHTFCHSIAGVTSGIMNNQTAPLNIYINFIIKV